MDRFASPIGAFKMKNKSLILLILAMCGTVIELFPITFMLFSSVIGSVVRGSFLMDYLIPAELGFMVFGGALILLFSAWKSPSDRRYILYGTMGVVISFGLMTLMSVVSGVDQTTDPSFWQMASIIIPLVLYDLASIEVSVYGIRYILKIWPKNAQ
jgi:hypothetical protein